MLRRSIVLLAATAAIATAAGLAEAQTQRFGSDTNRMPGISVPLPPPSIAVPSPGFDRRDFEPFLNRIANDGTGPQAILEEDCEWKNGGYAHCDVYDCDADGVCILYGEYCVDEYGHVMSCP